MPCPFDGPTVLSRTEWDILWSQVQQWQPFNEESYGCAPFASAPPCEKASDSVLLDFQPDSVAENNLGGLGPELASPRHMRFRAVGAFEGLPLELLFRNLTEYSLLTAYCLLLTTYYLLHTLTTYYSLLTTHH